MNRGDSDNGAASGRRRGPFSHARLPYRWNLVRIMGQLFILTAPSLCWAQTPMAPDPLPTIADPETKTDLQEPRPSVVPPPVVPPPGDSRQTIWVHVDAPDGAVLERRVRTGSRSVWEEACRAPCDRQLSLDPYYRVTGYEIRSSDKFQFSASAGEHERIRVRAASEDFFVLGVVGIVIGGGLTIGGLSVLFLSRASVDGSEGSHALAEPILGWILVGVGAPIAIAGIYLMNANRNTTISQSVVPPTTSRVRWRGFLEETHHSRTQPLPSFPVLGGTF